MTHYYWTYSRDFSREDEALDAEIRSGVSYAFEQQDKPIIEAQQASIESADLLALTPVMLAGDAAAVRARRVVEKLLRAENLSAAANGGAAAAPPTVNDL